MTPRQYAAAQKKLQKLYAMKARAMAPIEKRQTALDKQHAAIDARLRKAFDAAHHKGDKAWLKKHAPLQKRLAAVTLKFNKRIDAIARKIP